MPKSGSTTSGNLSTVTPFPTNAALPFCVSTIKAWLACPFCKVPYRNTRFITFAGLPILFHDPRSSAQFFESLLHSNNAQFPKFRFLKLNCLNLLLMLAVSTHELFAYIAVDALVSMYLLKRAIGICKSRQPLQYTTAYALWTGYTDAYFRLHRRHAWTTEMRRKRNLIQSAPPFFLNTLSRRADRLPQKPRLPWVAVNLYWQEV